MSKLAFRHKKILELAELGNVEYEVARRFLSHIKRYNNASERLCIWENDSDEFHKNETQWEHIRKELDEKEERAYKRLLEDSKTFGLIPDRSTGIYVWMKHQSGKTFYYD